MANSASSGNGGPKLNNGATPTVESTATQKKTTSLVVRAPPLPKITQGFVPLSLLITRLVQDSYNELQLMIDAIASGGMSSEQKKARITKYAISTRKQFIKLLVLILWAKDAGAVSDVIDLKSWLDTQHRVFESAVFVLSDIRRQIGLARYVWRELDERGFDADRMSGCRIRTSKQLWRCCRREIRRQA
jgi:hypothetical protein